MKKWKLPRKVKKKYFKIRNCKQYRYYYNVSEWEWFYFKRRVEVRCMEVILNSNSNEVLLEWYLKHYPNDKLAHHYCKQNRWKHQIKSELESNLNRERILYNVRYFFEDYHL